MKFLKFAFATLLFAALSTTAYAQDRPNLPEDQKQELVNYQQENVEKLALTPEQQEPFREISTRYFREYRENKKADIRVTEKFRKVKEIQDRKDAEMKKLLTESQYATYLTIQQERRDRMQGKR
jgi:Spy/CpxP family protein refolding chaperone